MVTSSCLSPIVGQLCLFVDPWHTALAVGRIEAGTGTIAGSLLAIRTTEDSIALAFAAEDSIARSRSIDFTASVVSSTVVRTAYTATPSSSSWSLCRP